MTKALAGADLEARRALGLDAILPVDRRDQLAQLLTDDEVVSLKHLARQASARIRSGRWPRIWPISKPGPRPRPPAPCPSRPEGPGANIRRPSSVGPRSGAKATPPMACRPSSCRRPACPLNRQRAPRPLHRRRGVAGPFATPMLRTAVRLAVPASAKASGRSPETFSIGCWRPATATAAPTLSSRAATPRCWSPSPRADADAAKSPSCASNSSATIPSRLPCM